MNLLKEQIKRWERESKTAYGCRAIAETSIPALLKSHERLMGALRLVWRGLETGSIKAPQIVTFLKNGNARIQSLSEIIEKALPK